MTFGVSFQNTSNWSYTNAYTVSEFFPFVPLEATNTVVLPLIGPTSTVFAPAITQTSLLIDLAVLGPTSTVFQPAITQTLDATVNLPAWNESTIVYTPAVLSGPAVIVLNFIASTQVFNSPAVFQEGGDVDTSDILNHYKKRERQENEIYEENIAAQILKKRRYDAEQKRKKKKKTAIQKFEDLVLQVAPEFRSNKRKKIKALLLLATMDDL
jgi:hypothetical protein